MSDDRLREIRERCEKTTAGAWTWLGCAGGYKLLSAHGRAVIHCLDAPILVLPEDRAFLANARSDIPYLLDRLATAEARGQALRKALERAKETIRGWHGMNALNEPLEWDLYQQSPEMKAINAELVEDVTCEHGTALDVHCCNCHSGFIFDKDHECPDPTAAPAQGVEAEPR